VHEVTLTGLQPETTYYFRVHSGQAVDDNEGALYQVTTRATELPPAPFLAYGQVESAGGVPAVGTLVRAWLVDGRGNESEPLSALVDGWGYWSLNVSSGMDVSSGLGLLAADCGDQRLLLEAMGPRGEAATLTWPACEAQPVTTMILTEATSAGAYLPIIVR
jgi:hypothetical protein